MSVYPTFVGGQRLTAALLTSILTLHAHKDSSTTIISDSSLNDDPDLFVTVEANAIYVLEFFFIVLGGTTGDFKMQFDGPTGTTGTWGAYALDTTAAAVAGATNVIRTPIGSPRSYGTVSSASGQVLIGRGLVRTDATAGTFKLSWSQDTSTATDTTLVDNSYIELRRVA
jgi:hypothetical protein